ncbi:hypothetical protein COT47_01175 [Candidatus Woesearchaeota archaeon CG08_land_8_20_14_0_20_43_7]|nr:MAG: hypothetical protein COT47_01175 [Candidatus Woesearchaeota archaeon CG08_land_8_20_14_0_20_43_7]
MLKTIGKTFVMIGLGAILCEACDNNTQSNETVPSIEITVNEGDYVHYINDGGNINRITFEVDYKWDNCNHKDKDIPSEEELNLKAKKGWIRCVMLDGYPYGSALGAYNHRFSGSFPAYHKICFHQLEKIRKKMGLAKMVKRCEEYDAEESSQ